MNTDPNCLSYWYPILQFTGVYTPRTKIIHTDVALDMVLDGKAPAGMGKFTEEVKGRCDLFGYPCFLRTGVFSGKHGWDKTCYVPCREDVGKHIFAIIEESELANMIGLPTNVWVVREFLDLDTRFTAFRGKMPINVERRYFIRDGAVQCSHPYWPHDAIRKPSDPRWESALRGMNEQADADGAVLCDMALRVAEHFQGYWSLDLARLRNGTWCAIDMAQGDRSCHSEGCEFVSPASGHGDDEDRP